MMKIYKLEYYSALKNEVTKSVGKWIDFEYISYNLREKKTACSPSYVESSP